MKFTIRFRCKPLPGGRFLMFPGVKYPGDKDFTYFEDVAALCDSREDAEEMAQFLAREVLKKLNEEE